MKSRAQFSNRLLCLTLLACLVCCSSVWAAEEDAAPPGLPSAMATIHIPWAIPLEGGALRVLTIAPRQGLRDVEELAQRVEMQQRVVALWDHKNLGYDPALPETHIPGGDAESVERALQDGLGEKLDVILIANCDFGILPAAVQEAIIQRVSGGCGLVVVQGRATGGALKAWLDTMAPDENRAQALRGLALKGTPGWTESGDFIATSAYEAGRIVQVVYPDSEPWTHCLAPGRPFPIYDFADYLDDHLALVIKCMLWSAQREGAARIEQITSASPTGPNEEEIPPGFPGEYIDSIRDSMMGGAIRPFRLFLNAPADAAYTVRVVVRNPETGMLVMNSMDTQLSKGQSFYNFDLLIGAGEYRCDAMLLKDGRVVDFFTQALNVDAWPLIEEVVFTKTYLMPNDSLDLTVKIASVLGAHRSATVYLRAIDAFGRKVAETSQVVNNEGGDVPVQLNFSDMLAPLLRVEVFALDGEQGTFNDAMVGNFARRDLYFPVRSLKGEWSMGIGAHVSVMGEANARRILHHLWKSGVNFYTNRFDADEMLHGAWAGLGYAPDLKASSANILEFNNSGDRARDVQQTVLNAWAGGAGRYWLGAHTLYGEGEELAFMEKGDITTFYSGLKNFFPELEMLNAAWDRKFIVWDGVLPASRDEARANEMLPNWMGLRRVLDAQRSESIGAAQSFVHSIDTAGLTGIIARPEAAESVGIPWPELSAVCDGVMLESSGDFWSLDLSQIASFKNAQQRNALLVRPEWLNGDAQRRSLPWRATLHQVNDLWCDTPFLYADNNSPNPMLQPDGTMNPAWQDLISVFQQQQYGPGEVIQRARRVHDGIGIYYSRASHALNAVETTFSCDSREAEASWLRLLDALGYRSVWVDAEAFKAKMGELRVLVLPAVRSLSDDEVDMLYAFIKGGGRLIADVAPGQYTEYGVRREQSPLAGAMGVDYDASAPQSTLEYKANESLPGLPMDLQHKPNTALAQSTNADAPIWLENKPEGYATLLLNHVAATAAFREALQRKLPPWVKLVQRFLAESGVSPTAFRDSEGVLTFDGEAACFDLETARFTLALAYPEAGGRQDFAPRFAEGVHVYNMLSGEAVVRPQRANFSLEPGGGIALAALPYAVKGLELTVPEETANGQRLNFQVLLTADAEQLLSHPVLVELCTLQGAPLPPYRQLLWCPGGVGGHYFPIALNDRIGACLVRARDLFSGAIVEHVVNVGDYRRPANMLQGRTGKE